VKTNGLIRRLIDRSDVSDFTIAVLVSVIYFKSVWLKEFKSYGEIKFLTKTAGSMSKPWTSQVII